MIRGGLVEVPVANVGAALRFYVETLGIKLVDDRGPGCALLDAGAGFRFALVERPASTPRVTLGLEVESMERAVSLLENRGIAFRSQSLASGASSAFTDPDGNTLALFVSGV